MFRKYPLFFLGFRGYEDKVAACDPYLLLVFHLKLKKEEDMKPSINRHAFNFD